MLRRCSLLTIVLAAVACSPQPSSDSASSPRSSAESAPTGSLALTVRLVPEHPAPCEPMAVYATLRNVGASPMKLSAAGPTIRVQGPDGQDFNIEGDRDTDRVYVGPVELAPGKTLSFKRWIIWVGRRPERRFAIPPSGTYRMRVHFGSKSLPSRVVELSAAAPDERQTQMVAKLLEPFPLQPPLHSKAQPFYPPSVPEQWWRSLSLDPSLPFPDGRVAAEQGRSFLSATLERLREVAEDTDTPYRWYAALVLAKWEATERDWPGYTKPARPQKAAEILEMLNKQPLNSALREEVLALQAQVYLLLSRWTEAENCLKKLEAMDPAEPLKSLIPRIRETKKKLLPPGVALR